MNFYTVEKNQYKNRNELKRGLSKKTGKYFYVLQSHVDQVTF